MCTKSEDFSCSRDMTGALKIWNGSRDLFKILTSPFTQISNGDVKCRQWDGLERLESSRSSAMSSFSRAHMTSYWTLVETMCLSFTLFEIGPYSEIFVESRWFSPTPLAFGFLVVVTPIKVHQEVWIVRRCLRDPTFSLFIRTPTCDRRTHVQTDRHATTTAYTKLQTVRDHSSRGENSIIGTPCKYRLFHLQFCMQAVTYGTAVALKCHVSCIISPCTCIQ